MATVSKTFSGNEYADSSHYQDHPGSWVVTLSWENALTASGSTFVVPAYTATAKYTNSYKSTAGMNIAGRLYDANGNVISNTYVNREYYGTWASGTTKTIPIYSGSESTSLSTSTYFNSNNRTTRSLNFQFNVSEIYGDSDSNDYGSNYWYGVNPWSGSPFTSTVTLTLNAPPTVTLGTPIYSTPQYAGLGSYSVPITQAKAQYYGYISTITLTVGNDSITQNYSATTVSNQTISLTPSTAGTYTPTITVTDTRGQVTTTNLSQITVNAYTAPSINFDLARCSSSGVPQAEGEYGLVTANISYVDAIAELTQPTVSVKDEGDNTIISSTTWYTTWDATNGVSNAVNWTNYDPTSPVTLYGVVSATGSSFSPSESYTVSITPTDNMGGVASTITQTLATAFFTIDFKAGGKEIAFGAPANDVLTNYPNGLFKCEMDMTLRGYRVPTIFISTSSPTANDGENGDVWLKYS